eukprot:15388122-Alexandrium_andersonii.AAC.1
MLDAPIDGVGWDNGSHSAELQETIGMAAPVAPLLLSTRNHTCQSAFGAVIPQLPMGHACSGCQ